MPAFNFSGPAEMLRAEQKDKELCERINGQLSEFILKFKGHIFVNKNKQHILCASQILYYAFTTLSKLQTLGEEYTRIVQVGKTGRDVPGILQSMGMISAQVFGEKCIILVLDRLINYVQDNKSITIQAKNQIIYFLTTIKSIIPLFQRLNRVLFYWNGSYYSWAKRFFNIRYIYAIPWYRPNRPLHVFKIVSVITSVHLSVLMYLALFKNQRVQKNEEEHTNNSVSESSNKCPLCLEPKRNISLTFCGHLFCWICIHEWLQTNNFCPMCRKTLKPRQIVPLQNFS